jgi:hypothetical protein
MKGNCQMKKPDPRQQIEHSGLFTQDSFDWIVDVILRNKDASYGSIDRKIRTSGELLSGDELIKLGLRANAKVSNNYYHSLTDKGKVDILGSAFLVAQRILHAESLFSRHEQISRSVSNADDRYEAEVMIPHDGDDEGNTACNAALDLQGKRFQFSEVPDLPLPECDSVYCRCMVRYHGK